MRSWPGLHRASGKALPSRACRFDQRSCPVRQFTTDAFLVLAGAFDGYVRRVGESGPGDGETAVHALCRAGRVNFAACEASVRKEVGKSQNSRIYCILVITMGHVRALPTYSYYRTILGC